MKAGALAKFPTPTLTSTIFDINIDTVNFDVIVIVNVIDKGQGMQ